VTDADPRVAVVTALGVEYESMRRHLAPVRSRMAAGETDVEVYDLPGSPWQVALTEAGPGAGNAAVVIERVIRRLRPQALLFVGIAGALSAELSIGDVVVATRVYAFEGGKSTPEGFYARPQSWHPSHRMLQTARAVLRDDTGVHFRPVAAGDVVLNDTRSLVAQLKRHYNDAVAIEMEGTSMAHAAHLTYEMDTLTIRGISDRADADKAIQDTQGSQRHAAARAAETAVAVLRALRPQPDRRDSEVRISGDRIDFHGSMFFGPVVGKAVGEPPRED